MKVSKNVLVIVGVVIVIAVALAAGALLMNTPQEKPIVIHAAYLPAAQSLPLFVAVEQGMFADAGLDVQIERIESPNQIIDSLVSGKMDAGAPSVAAGITAIVEAKNPGALKIYSLTCGTIGVLNDELIVAKDSNIQTISDLKGKKLGHIPGVQFQTMAKKVLAVNGVNPADVTLVELAIPTQLTSIASGAVDAVLTLEPNSTLGDFKGVSRLLVANPMVKSVADPWCGAAGVVSAEFLKNHPIEAQKFIKVMDEAIAETDSNALTREYLVSYLKVPEAVAKSTPMPVMVTSKDVNSTFLDAYQKFVDVFEEYKVIDKAPDVRKLFVN
jgi:NitT/TauT family transport system substrate-binding protein